MAQLGMRQPTDPFIDAFADSAPALETTSSDGSQANPQSTDTALTTLPLPLASTVGGVTTSDLSDIIFIYGTEGDDFIWWQGVTPVVIQGLGGNDQIYGPAGGNSFLSGDAGNDTLHGYGSNNNLSGGDGNDTLFGGPGT